MTLITSAFSAESLASMIAGPGFFTSGPVTGASVLGVTDGGTRFSEGKTVSSISVDGVPSGVRGLERIDGYEPTLSTTFKEMADSDMVRYFGAAFVGSAPKIITPPDVDSFVQTAGYIDDLRFWTKRADGKWVAIYFQSARPEVGEIQTGRQELGVPVTFRGKVKPDGTFSNLNSPPHRFEVHDTAPTLAP